MYVCSPADCIDSKFFFFGRASVHVDYSNRRDCTILPGQLFTVFVSHFLAPGAQMIHVHVCCHVHAASGVYTRNNVCMQSY